MYINPCKIIDLKVKYRFTICFCKYVKKNQSYQELIHNYALDMAVAYEHSVCTTGMTKGQIQQIRADEYNRLKPLVDEMVDEYLKTNPINIQLD